MLQHLGHYWYANIIQDDQYLFTGPIILLVVNTTLSPFLKNIIVIKPNNYNNMSAVDG